MADHNGAPEPRAIPQGLDQSNQIASGAKSRSWTVQDEIRGVPDRMTAGAVRRNLNCTEIRAQQKLRPLKLRQERK